MSAVTSRITAHALLSAGVRCASVGSVTGPRVSHGGVGSSVSGRIGL
jgi:hypothetical protein